MSGVGPRDRAGWHNIQTDLIGRGCVLESLEATQVKETTSVSCGQACPSTISKRLKVTTAFACVHYNLNVIIIEELF